MCRCVARADCGVFEPHSPAGQLQLTDSTRANALSAMHGEALAHAKYLAYATQAQQAGRLQAAQEFTIASQTELSDHFAREADLIGLGGDVAANLRDAISGETNEVDTMYPGFATPATADDDPAAAALFTEIAADEATHLKGFTDSVDRGHQSGDLPLLPWGSTPTPAPIAVGSRAVVGHDADEFACGHAG